MENVCKVLFETAFEMLTAFDNLGKLKIKRQVQNPYYFLLEDPKTPIPVCWSTLDIFEGERLNDKTINLCNVNIKKATFLRLLYLYFHQTS